MFGMFKRKEEIMQHVEENEAKYKEQGRVDLEKGDKFAIFIASFLVFAPFLLILMVLFLVAYILA